MYLGIMCVFRVLLYCSAHLLAALVGGAPRVFAQDTVSTVYRGVVVGARVTRAVGSAALLFLALAVVALHVIGVLDRSVAVRAADGVAVQRVYVVVGFVVSCRKPSENRL